MGLFIRKMWGAISAGNYSDKDNTSLEKGIEYGFGLVLGASSAAFMIALLFFIFASLFSIL